MSRGLGWLQVGVIAELRQHGASNVQKLCARIFREWPVTDSQYSAARRAVRGLVARGLVVEKRRNWCVGRSAMQTMQNVYALQEVTDLYPRETLSCRLAALERFAGRGRT